MYVYFQKSKNSLSGNKELKRINYAMMKYVVKFNDRQMILILAFMEVNRFKWPWEYLANMKNWFRDKNLIVLIMGDMFYLQLSLNRHADTQADLKLVLAGFNSFLLRKF